MFQAGTTDLFLLTDAISALDCSKGCSDESISFCNAFHSQSRCFALHVGQINLFSFSSFDVTVCAVYCFRSSRIQVCRIMNLNFLRLYRRHVCTLFCALHVATVTPCYVPIRHPDCTAVVLLHLVHVWSTAHSICFFLGDSPHACSWFLDSLRTCIRCSSFTAVGPTPLGSLHLCALDP